MAGATMTTREVFEALRDAVKEEQARCAKEVSSAIMNERNRCVQIIRTYLLFDSQRAVSWHEVQDCIIAIQKRPVAEDGA